MSSVLPAAQAGKQTVRDPLGLDEQKQRQIKSVAYMNVKCGVDGEGYTTYQHREYRKRSYKPGVYKAKKDIGCCGHPPTLNHLSISKEELRFSYAKELKYNCCSCLFDSLCCQCFKNIRTENFQQKFFNACKSKKKK